MQLDMLFRILFVALTSVAGLVLSGFMPAIAQSEQSIVVLVNDEPITNYDITQRMSLLSVTTRKPANDAMRKRVIEDLISERIQLQEATKSSVIISDDQINEVLGRIAKSNNMTRDQLTASLAQLGVNTKTMKDQTTVTH